MFEEHNLTDLLASFFYEKGYVRIPHLGTLRLPEGSVHALDNRHELPGPVSFEYDPGQQEDPELVDFITDRTRKMRALAVSDLLSLADQAREMLNMGQSYTLRSLATLSPDGRGGFSVVRDKSPFQLTPKTKEPAFNTTHKPPVREGRIHSTGSRRTAAGVLMTAICIGIGALLVYFLFFHRQSPGTRTPEDSGIPRPAEVEEATGGGADASANADGLLHYEAVFEHAIGERALARYRQLTSWGHQIVLHTDDSVHYSLAIRFTTPATDTTAVKDSIALLYGHPVNIRLLP